MPSVVGKASININQSLAKHAQDQTEEPQDFSRLPCGEYSGIARLTTAKLGTYKPDAKGGLANQRFLRLAASVIEPDAVMEVVKELATDPSGRPVLNAGKAVVRVVAGYPRECRISGRQTSVMFSLCDTERGQGKDKKVIPADEHIADMLNQLRLIAGEDFTNDITSEEDLESKLRALEEAKPFFKFSVWTGDPTPDFRTPRPVEKWYRGLPDYAAAAAAVNGQPHPAVTSAADSTPTPKTDTGASAAFSEVGTPEELAAKAEEGDEVAMDELKRLAMASGISESDVENAESWTALAEQMGTAEGGEGSAEETAAEEPDEFLPKKEEIYYYHPFDTKTKKPAKKSVECEVLTVQEKGKTVTLKNLETGKTIIDLKTKKPLAVKWDDLSGE